MIKVSCPQVKEHPVRPASCMYCLSKRVSIHQTIQRPVKDSLLQKVTVQRFSCFSCYKTFRSYPDGVKRYSSRTKRLVFLGILLYTAGLSYAKVVLFLEALMGKRIEHSVTVWRDIQRLGDTLRRTHFGIAKKGAYVIAGIDGGYFKVQGKKMCILFSVDNNDNHTILFDTKREENKEELKAFLKELTSMCYPEAVVTDDWELYKEPLEKQEIPHQVCLAHVKKNYKKQLKRLPKEVPKHLIGTVTHLLDNPNQYGLLTLEEAIKDEYLWRKGKERTEAQIQTRELFASLLRKWKQYTEYCHNPYIPKTNNHTERAIGRSKCRYITTRGLKSRDGLLNFLAVTQIFGEHNYNLLKQHS